ncbi:MAG: Rpn family recombination-promoting nuclease/putative transposase [Myxococcota bacterium]
MANKNNKQQQQKNLTDQQLRQLLAIQGVSSECFRYMMCQPKHARYFCKHYLTKKLTNKMYLRQIEMLSDRFVDPHVQAYIGDVVLRAPTRPKQGWVYIIILQCCRSHPLMPFYLDHCHKRVLKMHAATIKDDTPVDVYPAIYYTGQGRYPGPTTVEEALEGIANTPIGEA